MAAGPGDSLEATLDRKFRNVSNTMDSIQGLSTWCIDNKKYHSLIVKHWMKSLRKADAPHRLNLLYLANDVIQNCKRKNAIVYRTAFAEVLPDAFLLVNHEGDPKVIKSVERILSIWEDRGVYSGVLVSDLRSTLIKEESPPETPVEQKTPVESRADLRSKIVAEFVPQALIDQLSKHKKSLEDVDIREKQLAAMRVDICSTEALKKLKDKAGGKKFSKDFEEGSAQLQGFVKFFDKQSKLGPPLLEALRNADIFYEMQYKEVKIVANAYQTFANRVSHLKRKLDSLKATLPDLDDSPIPSPSADAPSPTGSESPFHGLELAEPHPDLDGCAMDDDAEAPAPSPLSSVGESPVPEEVIGGNDNREVEDMDLSEEEIEGSSSIIVEEKIEPVNHSEVSSPVCTQSESSAETKPVPQLAPLAVEDSIDVGKIGSILNNLNSVMTKTAVSPPAAAPASTTVETTPAAPLSTLDSSSLTSILSKVDMSPAELLSALSKVQSHSSIERERIASSVSSSTARVSSDLLNTSSISPTPSSTSASTHSQSFSSAVPMPSAATLNKTQSSSVHALPPTPNPASALIQAVHKDMELTTEADQASSSTSLESKIHSFLQGNPAFNAFDFGFSSNSGSGGENLSPAPGADTQDGTPVRDEGGGTPTQDEAMDKSLGIPFPSNTNRSPAGESTMTSGSLYQNSSQPSSLNGQRYQSYPYIQQEGSKYGSAATAAHFQQISAQAGMPMHGERAPGVGSTQAGGEGWFSDTPSEGSSQPPHYNAETAPSGRYHYQAEHKEERPELAPKPGSNASSAFFSSSLPPVPHLPPPPPPPPPHTFDGTAPLNNRVLIPPEQQPFQGTGEAFRQRDDGFIGGMMVQDHHHKSPFPPDNDMGQHHPRQPDNMPYPDEGPNYYPEHHSDAPFFPDNSNFHSNDSNFGPVSPPHPLPRLRGRLPGPHGGPQEFYQAHTFQRPRRPPPPPHQGMRQPGLLPLHRPLHPARLPHSRGPTPRPPFPRFLGPDPRLRGKRPGPRGGGPGFALKRPFLPPRY